MSFGTYARRVRDTARPYGERYGALRCAVSMYCPVGFTATWSWLDIAGDLRRDDAALAAALDRVERSRGVWLAEMSAFASRRRAEKDEHRRTPTREERRFLYGWRWPGPDGHAVTLHTVENAWTGHRTAPSRPYHQHKRATSSCWMPPWRATSRRTCATAGWIRRQPTRFYAACPACMRLSTHSATPADTTVPSSTSIGC
ncbi:hypothetical protein ACFQZ4_49865 [Catellatospora coxensis]